MSRKVALYSVHCINNDCYECGGSKDLRMESKFEEVSDEDYQLLIQFITRQKSYYNRYVLIEPVAVEEVRESLDSIIEKIKKEKKAEAIRRKKQDETNAKRQATLAEKRIERDKKRLEELKKRLGES